MSWEDIAEVHRRTVKCALDGLVDPQSTSSYRIDTDDFAIPYKEARTCSTIGQESSIYSRIRFQSNPLNSKEDVNREGIIVVVDHVEFKSDGNTKNKGDALQEDIPLNQEIPP